MTNSVKWYDRGRYICRYVAEIYASQQDCGTKWDLYIDGLVQDCSNSSELAMELQQHCTKPSICGVCRSI